MKAVEPSQVVNLAGKSLAEQGRSVMEALANGDIAVGQAGTLLSSLGTMAKLVEVDELTRRIQALEDRHASR